MAKRTASTATATRTGDTAVGDPGPDPTVTAAGPTSAADLAARRRAGRDTSPAPHPTGAAPAPVDGDTPVTVIASRTLVSGFGGGGPARPVGGVWSGRPLVLETSPGAVGGVQPHDPLYVVAECDAQQHTVPPNCVTPVTTTLWHRGMRVRRDLYDAVMAAHAERAADGTAELPYPAELPAGIDDVPADAVQPTPEGGATAGTTVAAPIVVSADPTGPVV